MKVREKYVSGCENEASILLYPLFCKPVQHIRQTLKQEYKVETKAKETAVAKMDNTILLLKDPLPRPSEVGYD